ncbi:MAG: guanylate kinase [Chloroflexi bacterium 44-23]|nr:MAG: guanylate kinase [Chloroflexi bacterium 44-23]
MSDEQISFDLLKYHPLLIVLSGPSGVGKDATLKELKKRDLPLYYVITATTRKKRKGEIAGVDYSFYSKEEFERMIADGELLEHAIVYEDYKGIPKQQVIEAFASNKDVILRVDVQGARTLREMFPQAVLIFLLPTSVEEWHERLNRRKTETDQSLKVRMEKVKWELGFLDIFDYMVVNRHNCLEKTVDSIVEIIHAEHHRTQPRRVTL